ncbi:MAG: N-acetylmuramoyl-L-alanine amidase [Bacillota bacterium]|uniref:Cell wall hydrolase n=1 Tax=Thermanaerosceptrum fracticalcis TaxID=1712410 RepID=A0A7G6E5X4_THEFR|nr:N-acetylmuramoyl-L-alanine amidase [Thermanaerosceptrum fracticalcis]QNB47478.1 cell wall hydrolase [Thermanaerosceptrum fracticalcis]
MRIIEIKKRYIVWALLVVFVAGSLFRFEHWRKSQEAQAIRAMSWVVASRVIIVDPGHGGEDPGKVSPSGVYEKDINLAVAKKLFTILSQGGATVIMTRDKDAALSNGQDTVRQRKRADLISRVELAEKANADMYIALHCNSFPSGRWYGAQTFYSPSVPGSKELATFIQEELVAFLGNTTRKPKADSSSLIFKTARLPIVNVEMGFLSNKEEEKLLQDPAYQDKIAWSIYAGVVRYLMEYGEQYKPTMEYIEK